MDNLKNPKKAEENTISDQMYCRMIKEWLSREIESPSPDFVKHILNNIYDGVRNQSAIDKFTLLIKRSISEHINDLVNSNQVSENKKDKVISYQK